MYAWTLGIGVAGVCVCGALARDLRGACRGPYLGINRAEISLLLRFGEISPLLRLANTCYYVLRNRGGLCYPVFAVGKPTCETQTKKMNTTIETRFLDSSGFGVIYTHDTISEACANLQSVPCAAWVMGRRTRYETPGKPDSYKVLGCGGDGMVLRLAGFEREARAAGL